MDITRLVDEYAVWHEVSGHSPKTIALYRWALGAFRSWLVKHDHSTAIESITIADVRAFLQSEQQRTELYPDHPTSVQRAGKLSDRTIHVYARSIRAFFRWLVEEGRLSTNPMARLKPPKLEKRYKEILNVAEMERLLSELNQRTFLGSRMYAMIALLYDSGLRASELTGINASDIEWGSYQVRVMGKGKQERLVPFSPTTQRALRKYLTLRERFAFDDTEALFINVDGRRLTPGALNQAVKRLGIRVGIPRLHPHLLRHSAAVTMVMNGGDQFALKRILGHSQLSTTDGYMDYAQQHLAERHRQFSPMSKINERRTATAKIVRSRSKRRRAG